MSLSHYLGPSDEADPDALFLSFIEENVEEQHTDVESTDPDAIFLSDYERCH